MVNVTVENYMVKLSNWVVWLFIFKERRFEMKRAKCIALILLLVLPLSFTHIGCGGSSSDSSNLPATEGNWDEMHWDMGQWG